MDYSTKEAERERKLMESNEKAALDSAIATVLAKWLLKTTHDITMVSSEAGTSDKSVTVVVGTGHLQHNMHKFQAILVVDKGCYHS